MRRKVVFLLALTTLLFFGSQVYAKEHPGYAGDIDLGTEGRTHNPIPVLVAYDEEITNLEEIKFQTIRGLYRFPWQFEIIGYESWTSTNTYGLHDGILEMESQIRWFHGKSVGGQVAVVLIGWTGQDVDELGGVAHVGHGSVLIKRQADWTDDNTVQHEVTHIFGVISHCTLDCIMSREYIWYWFITEYWTPYSGSKIIAIFNWQTIDSVTQTWCDSHYADLLASKGIIYNTMGLNSVSKGESMSIAEAYQSTDGYITTDPEIQPYGNIGEINTPIYEYTPIIMVTGVAITALITLLYWKRSQKHKRLS